MSLTHISTFRVRHYECDAYGHLNNANYARYMQEAAFDASAALGYTADRYDAEGLLWLAYETDIEYFQPVHYRDVVEVKTWVANFRRIRSLRRYEFRRAGSDELIARAETDWVLLNAATLHPTPIPPHVISAYVGNTIDSKTPRRHRLIPAPPPLDLFRLRKRVEWRDIDTAQHVNNAAYFNYVEDCGIQAAASVGWPIPRMRQDGFALVTRQHHMEYKQAARLDDELEIATWLSDVKSFSTTRHYTITRVQDKSVIGQAHTLWICVSLVTGKPMRFPPALLTDFAPTITLDSD